MKIFNIITTAIIIISLNACGSKPENSVSVDINTSNETLKKFKTKGNIAYYGGMNFGGKTFQRVLYLVVGNYDDVKLGLFNVEAPKKKGETYIAIAVFGPEGTDQKNLTPLETGTYSTHPDENGKKFTVAILSHDESNKWGKQETLSGEPVVKSSDVSGTLELTEVSDNMAKGKLTYKIEGGHELTMDFSTNITKDLWVK